MEGLSPSMQDRGATCELWPPTGRRHSRGTRASATAVTVSREVAIHTSLPCVRRAALAVIGLRDTVWHYTGGRPLSFDKRPWCDVRAVPATRRRHSRGTRTSATAVAVSQEVAKQASLPRVGRVVLFVIGLRDIGGHYTGGRPFSFDARPWCDMRAVASNGQAAFTWHACKRNCGDCLSRGGNTHELAVRAPCRAGCDRSA